VLGQFGVALFLSLFEIFQLAIDGRLDGRVDLQGALEVSTAFLLVQHERVRLSSLEVSLYVLL